MIDVALSERRSSQDFGLDIESDESFTTLMSGRRKVGFIFHHAPEVRFGAYVYEYDSRSGMTKAQYIGTRPTLKEAIQFVAQTYREQIPSWVGKATR